MDFYHFLSISKHIPKYKKKIKSLDELIITDDSAMMMSSKLNITPFITIIFVIENKLFSNTFYKRYKYFFEEWQCIEYNFLDVSTGVSKYQFILLKDIISNKLVQIQEYHHPYDKNLIGKYVCNKKVWTSAIIIKKTWIKYKYVKRLQKGK